MSPPADDELEVSLFGPGFGESLVVHVGSGTWLIIDSCIDATNGVPAPLYYLNQMQVDPASAVKSVVVTHWHDDHIRGMGKILRACSGARVCIPSALHTVDFVRAIVTLEGAFSGVVSSGVAEINEVFRSAQMKAGPVVATENTIIWSAKGSLMAHAADVELRALSPSGTQGLAMLTRVASMVRGSNGSNLGRAPRSGSNDLAIASWLCCGEHTLLFGADLEVHANPACGWGAIRAIANQLPGGKADVFKVPHHGSSTGDDPKVWADMLAHDPIAILTPWTRGTGLPQPSDLDRIRNNTRQGHITNMGRMANVAKRDPAVEKTLKENGIDLLSCEGLMGHIRLRKKPNSGWTVEHFGAAVKL